MEVQVSADMVGGVAGMKVPAPCSSFSDANLAGGWSPCWDSASPEWKCQLPTQPLEAGVAIGT